mmetsp:Transcript_8289/g.11540  ORF Transcript_8289/g.11540 Transcript_8289/m.11540 type:complete len:303 (+) Transcript_8289:851-1759(+)
MRLFILFRSMKMMNTELVLILIGKKKPVVVIIKSQNFPSLIRMIFALSVHVKSLKLLFILVQSFDQHPLQLPLSQNLNVNVKKIPPYPLIKVPQAMKQLQPRETRITFYLVHQQHSIMRLLRMMSKLFLMQYEKILLTSILLMKISGLHYMKLLALLHLLLPVYLFLMVLISVLRLLVELLLSGLPKDTIILNLLNIFKILAPLTYLTNSRKKKVSSFHFLVVIQVHSFLFFLITFFVFQSSYFQLPCIISLLTYYFLPNRCYYYTLWHIVKLTAPSSTSTFLQKLLNQIKSNQIKSTNTKN